jgi:hypothetical protein
VHDDLIYGFGATLVRRGIDDLLAIRTDEIAEAAIG